MLTRFLRGLMRFLTRTYLVGLFRVEGAENIPRSGGLIVCGNHFATLDPPMVPAFLPRADSWSMAKSEYFRKRRMRWLFKAYQAFPVVRHTADRAALRKSFDLLKAGQVLIIYPEGTRVEAGVLSAPEPGAGGRRDRHTRVYAQGNDLAAPRPGADSVWQTVPGGTASPRRRTCLPRGGFGRDHARDRRASASGKAWTLQRPRRLAAKAGGSDRSCLAGVGPPRLRSQAARRCAWKGLNLDSSVPEGGSGANPAGANPGGGTCASGR